MEYERLPGVDGVEIRVPRDDAHRTCAVCGGDCIPEPVPTEAGMRVAFACPKHGIHAVIDPFEDTR